MKRRSMLTGTLATLGFAILSGNSFADTYPNKPIEMVVGYAAGGPTDVTGRTLAQQLSDQMGVPVVVANKTGGASLIGTKEVLQAKPDGYTLLFASLGHNVNPILLPSQANYDPIKDFEPITLVATQPLVVVTAYDSEYKTLQDIIDAAKKDPGGISFGSAGNGGSAHLAAELLGVAANVDMLHVPFRGNAPALAEVMAGRVAFMFYPSVGLTDHVRGNRLRVLAVGPTSGLAQFPDAPTMASLGYNGFDDAAPWVGLLAPKGTPAQVVSRLSSEMNKAMENPQVRERLESLGNVLVGGPPEVFIEYLGKSTDTMTDVVRKANLPVK